jgi:hypothetical protein
MLSIRYKENYKEIAKDIFAGLNVGLSDILLSPFTSDSNNNGNKNSKDAAALTGDYEQIIIEILIKEFIGIGFKFLYDYFKDIIGKKKKGKLQIRALSEPQDKTPYVQNIDLERLEEDDLNLLSFQIEKRLTRISEESEKK